MARTSYRAAPSALGRLLAASRTPSGSLLWRRGLPWYGTEARTVDRSRLGVLGGERLDLRPGSRQAGGLSQHGAMPFSPCPRRERLGSRAKEIGS